MEGTPQQGRALPVLLIILVVVILAAIGFWWWYLRAPAPSPTTTPTPAPTTQKAPDLEKEAEEADLNDDLETIEDDSTLNEIDGSLDDALKL